MVDEVDFHKEGALLIREVALRAEEAALPRLCAGLFDRGEHIASSSRRRRADFDLATVAESSRAV